MLQNKVEATCVQFCLREWEAFTSKRLTRTRLSFESCAFANTKIRQCKLTASEGVSFRWSPAEGAESYKISYSERNNKVLLAATTQTWSFSTMDVAKPSLRWTSDSADPDPYFVALFVHKLQQAATLQLNLDTGSCDGNLFLKRSLVAGGSSCSGKASLEKLIAE